jgi:NOL1/NOP2/fmu family ribosome biogenesis protein
MMAKLKILNSKKSKHIRQMIKDQWGAEIPLEHVFLENEKGKIFLVTKEFGDLVIEKLNIQTIGNYFAEVVHNSIRLSIEGSRMVGKNATKKILEVDDEEARAWVAGNDLNRTGSEKGFLIVKNRTDFLGTGKYGQDRFCNYVPKSRRINLID